MVDSKEILDKKRDAELKKLDKLHNSSDQLSDDKEIRYEAICKTPCYFRNQYWPEGRVYRGFKKPPEHFVIAKNFDNDKLKKPAKSPSCGDQVASENNSLDTGGDQVASENNSLDTGGDQVVGGIQNDSRNALGGSFNFGNEVKHDKARSNKQGAVSSGSGSNPIP